MYGYKYQSTFPRNNLEIEGFGYEFIRSEVKKLGYTYTPLEKQGIVDIVMGRFKNLCPERQRIIPTLVERIAKEQGKSLL